MKHRIYYLLFFFVSLFGIFACDSEEASEMELTSAAFLDYLGGNISSQQWWKTAVSLKINVISDQPVKLWLIDKQEYQTLLYDYKEISGSGTVTMTAPQGQSNELYLRYVYKNTVSSQTITLSGKLEEYIKLDVTSSKKAQRKIYRTPPASLCGNSIRRNAEYYQFSNDQLTDFFSMMELNQEKADAKYALGLNCNYELGSNGPFYITWVTGNEGEQRSRILGYYYHSPTTYEDIKYVDLSETHKWDYIDGLSKVQYQINQTDEVDGHVFYPNTWYDANFDMSDVYGATSCYNMDRVGDDAYNAQAVYNRHKTNISALRGISFKINVPAGKRIGFFLRSDEENYSSQYELLNSNGIRPYVSNASIFKGTCFSAEFMNIEGNGKGTHRSFIEDYERVYWLGMEDLVEGGDHDCNDVIFGIVADVQIYMPTILDPTLEDPGPDPDPDPIDIDDMDPMPWTIAYEDVSRKADFDFNDAVIKLEPDYDNELCCVTVMAAGSTSRMYLHYDGPNGDENLGEIHELLGSKKSETLINTQSVVANTPFAQIDCVPWPKGYTMGQDAKRFYIEIQRGTCEDCTDLITLANEPGQLPEALLVAGEWHWPMEGVNINSAYTEFPKWAQDVTRTRFWEWYQTSEYNKSVSF